MKLDILVFAAHPDDAELGCGGTLIKHIQLGKKAGIVDLTRGELGTRGTPEIRAEEAKKAAEILGVSVRENLGMPDGFFENNKENQIYIIKKIREFQPEVVLANSFRDRHPDHGRAAKLVSDACYLSGLAKVDTGQEPWRPRAVYHYIQGRYVKPDFVVDITDILNRKMEAVQAFSSQFHNPDSQEPETPISTPLFFDYLKGRLAQFGRMAGVQYAEGFTTQRSIGVKNLFDLK